MSVTKGQLNVKRCYVEWSLYFSEDSLRKNTCLISPTFQFSDSTWFLKFTSDDGQRYLCPTIRIELVKQPSETEMSHIVSFRVGIKTKNDMCYKSFKSIYRFTNAKKSYDFPLSRKQFLDDMYNFFPDGLVIFYCDVVIGGEETLEAGTQVQLETGVNAETQINVQDGCSSLPRDLKKSLLSGEGADVTIKVKSEEFRAHSQILSARSSVFAPMFKHDTKEKKTGVVEIPECEPDVFKEFLTFLYTGQADNLSPDNDIDLYSIADKYDVKELKAICSESMLKNITIDSFCDVLCLSIRYDDKDLMDFLIDYFIKNVKTIIVTLKWMSFAKEYPTQSNELVVKLAHHFLPEKNVML